MNKILLILTSACVLNVSAPIGEFLAGLFFGNVASSITGIPGTLFLLKPGQLANDDVICRSVNDKPIRVDTDMNIPISYSGLFNMPFPKKQ